MSAPPIPGIVRQHAEESASLRDRRSHAVGAGHVGLFELARLDRRLAAHLDGLAVAGQFGSEVAMAALQSPGRGEVFTATVRALEARDRAALDRLIALATGSPALQAGLLSAFGWVSAATLQGVVQEMLASADDARRQVGLSACAMHGVDPGMAAAAALTDSDAAVRAQGLRTVARLGRVDLLPACLAAAGDGDACCAGAARVASILLGERGGAAVAQLLAQAEGSDASAQAAMQLALKLIDPPSAGDFLRALARDPAKMRALIRAVATAGDPHYVPWLIHQMREPQWARLAGEAFSMLTGMDLSHPDFDPAKVPATESDPLEDPIADEDVDDEDPAMIEDEGLPQADPDKVERWWHANQHAFAPGVRYFMGSVPSLQSCAAVLRSGRQRQRRAAAEHMALLRPGTPLFNCAAPAWRQQRALGAAMP